MQDTSQSACKRESFPRIAQLLNATKSESVVVPVDDAVSAIGARNMRSNSVRSLILFGELISFALSVCLSDFHPSACHLCYLHSPRMLCENPPFVYISELTLTYSFLSDLSHIFVVQVQVSYPHWICTVWNGITVPSILCPFKCHILWSSPSKLDHRCQPRYT